MSNEVEVGDDVLVIECEDLLSLEQRMNIAESHKDIGRQVLILDGGMKLARNYSERLDRIEAKLDTILQAFEDEAAEDEDESTTITTMEGESINIPAGPMTL